MNLPTPTQQSQLTKLLASTAASASVSILGVPLDASSLEALLDVAVAAACMKQWQQAQAAGQAAADAITTEAQAEAAQRK